MNDRTAQWVSASAYGQVYSFLSADDLWWGSIAGTSIGLSGVKVPAASVALFRDSTGLWSLTSLFYHAQLPRADFKQGLTVGQGFGFDPTTGHMVVGLYDCTPGYLVCML